MQNNLNHAELPTFETNRLRLRKMNRDDAEDLFALATDPELSALNTWEKIETLAEAQMFIEDMNHAYKERIVFPWGIETKADQRFIGFCGFGECYLEDKRADIHGVLAKSYWSKGFMTEAMNPVIHYGFQTLNFHRIEGKCLAGNRAAEKVMKKLGMSLEGVLRERIKWKGEYHDLKLFALLNK